MARSDTTTRKPRTPKKTGKGRGLPVDFSGLSFGEALKATRRGKAVRLRELAKELGVSLPYLSDVENGRRPLSDDRIMQAAAFLEANALTLLELAARGRGKVVLDISEATSERSLRAITLLSLNWPNVSTATVDYLLNSLKSS